jgi:hypothetical protein
MSAQPKPQRQPGSNQPQKTSSATASTTPEWDRVMSAVDGLRADLRTS